MELVLINMVLDLLAVRTMSVQCRLTVMDESIISEAPGRIFMIAEAYPNLNANGSDTNYMNGVHQPPGLQ